MISLVISTGQDSRNLCPLLLEQGQKIICTYRYSSQPLDQRLGGFPRQNEIEFMCMDLCDASSVNAVMSEVAPDNVFCMGALSNVGHSFSSPYQHCITNAIGPLNVLEAIRIHSPHTRGYFCGSSEEFGSNVDSDGFQRITTPLQANSVYAASKIMSRNLVSVYRRSYNLFVVTGLLFNHTSIHRTPPENFIESKIAQYVGKMINWEERHNTTYPYKLKCGLLTPKRDFGWSEDYMRAAMLMLEVDTPKDYVVATGETHSIEEIMQYMFGRVSRHYKDYIEQVPEFMRPIDVNYLCGDSAPIRQELGWQTTKTFSQLMDMLVDHFIKQEFIK